MVKRKNVGWIHLCMWQSEGKNTEATFLPVSLEVMAGDQFCIKTSRNVTFWFLVTKAQKPVQI